jgi:hypothetical protein
MLLELLGMPLTRGEIREIFDDYNIPEDVTNFVLKFDLTSRCSWLYRYSTPAFAVIGILITYPLLLWLDELQEQTVLSAAQKQAALFYDTDPATNLIAFLIVIILLAHTISRYIPLLVSPKLKAQIFIHDHMSVKNKLFLKFPYKLLRRRKPREKTSSPIEYLNQHLRSEFRFFRNIAALSALAMFALISQNLNAYTLITKDGVQQTSILPWTDKVSSGWGEVKSVTLGCRHTKDSDYIVYQLNFKSDKPYRLTSMKPVEGASRGDWLSALEKVDQILIDNNVVFEHRKTPDNIPVNSKCLKAQEARYTPQEMQRLRRLLRISTLEGD